MAQYEVLDVSKYNTVTDYKAAANSVDGVIMRAGYRGYGSTGTLTKDPMFETHYNGFSQYTKVGVYWFTQATSEAEAKAEADYLYSLIKDKNISFPIYLDSEYSNSSHSGRADGLTALNRTTYAVAFLDRMKALGYKAGIYASDSWFVNQLQLSTIYSKGYSIWCAKYSTTAPKNVTNYDGWQYTSDGTITGVSGSVDLSHFYADVAGWGKNLNIADYVKGITPTSFEYDGTPHSPDVILYTPLKWNVDYYLTYANNTEPGTATATVVGKGDYIGYVSFPFYIVKTKKDISEYIKGITPSSYEYDGSPKYPAISFYDGKELVLNTDYVVSYNNNVEIGTGSVVITAVDNSDYTGSITYNFNIVEPESKVLPSIVDYISGITPLSYTYDGNNKEPSVISNLTTDCYNVSYSNNLNAGTGTCVVSGIEDKGYSGSVSYNFTINKANISDYITGIDNNSYTYDGKEQRPNPVIISPLTLNDCKITYSNNINVGQGTISIEGINNFTGVVSYTFTINSPYGNIKLIQDYVKELSGTTVFTYDGSAKKPTVNDNGLTVDVDYTVEYTNNTNAGTAICTVTGINNYAGIVTLPFTIEPADISNVEARLPVTSFEYNQQEIKPEVIVVGLVADIDYKITYESNINVGTGIVIITGINNYTNRIELRFSITVSTISGKTLTTDRESYRYTGQPIEPKCNIDGLKQDEDYIITYTNNIEIGTGTATATGINNYRGECKTTFVIGLQSLEEYFLTLSPTQLTFTGETVYPNAYINNLSSVNYEITYPEESINPGVYTVYASGLGQYVGTISAKYSIIGDSIGKFTPRMDTNIYQYKGGPVEPKVTIEGLQEGIDFNVIYTNNYNPGKARATIYGMGNYSGDTYLEYTIVQSDIDTVIGKLGIPTIKSDYRVVTTSDVLKLYGSLEEYNKGSDPLIEDFDYTITDIYSKVLTEFSLVTYKIKGINGYYGETVLRFRAISREPSYVIDYTDNLVYNFGDIDTGDETADGDYDFKELTIIKSIDVDYGDIDTISDDEPEEKVKDGDDYDFDILSTMHLAHYDIDDGHNIDENGNEKGGTAVIPADDDDDGVYNFGDIDLNDETAEGDYDFGDLDEGVDEDSVANGDYDFNLFAGDVDTGYPAGTEFVLNNTPIYAIHSSRTTNTRRSGLYYIYNSSVINKRIRVIKNDEGIGEPARAAGWVNMSDLERLEKLSIGDIVMVNGPIYLYADGKRGYIDKSNTIMYIVDVLDEVYEYPYALASSPTNTKQGYANKDILTRLEEV